MNTGFGEYYMMEVRPWSLKDSSFMKQLAWIYRDEEPEETVGTEGTEGVYENSVHPTHLERSDPISIPGK